MTLISQTGEALLPTTQEQSAMDKTIEVMERWLIMKDLKKLDIDQLEKFNSNFVSITHSKFSDESVEIVQLNWNYCFYQCAITELRNTYQKAFNAGFFNVEKSNDAREEE